MTAGATTWDAIIGYWAYDAYNVGSVNARRVLPLRHLYPELLRRVFYPCRCWGRVPRENEMYEIIMHLNDIHEWSRDSVADWVDEVLA